MTSNIPKPPGRPTRRAVLATAAAAAGATALGAAPARADSGHRAHGTAPHGTASGAALYSVVEGYSRWTHRTGTQDESAALDWLGHRLRERGAVTGRWHYDYPHYRWSAEVRVGRVPVPTVPLYYEGTGKVEGRADFVRPVTTSKDGSDPAVLAAVAEAAAAGASVAVLPTTSTTATYLPYDGLVGYNSDPDAAKTGVPTLLVPGHLAGHIQQYGADVDFSARTVRARTYCLTGWFGTRKPVSDPIVVTTPLTGWFTCAAERGTGIALALALAAELSREHPVFFLGNTGHELNNYGARAYLADEFDLAPRAVFHLGSALAAAAAGPDGHFELAPRGAASNPGFDAVPGLAADLATARFTKAAKFPGEGAVWNAALGNAVPLLSLAGNFRQFHTPDDTPRVTTSPEVLEQAYTAVRAAARDLLSAT
ncbi:hypothetical protein NMG29_35290 [Streptomyces cocklensis]|uniref:Uncharacterized protein n=1 Tax=Actinacidiphila cocklensis TaxID=887465 RepID=A0A9W4E4P2_9ACTN|nr:hypothetical protein [Actinacidiphila cocklensis]MDD1063380.1 hypothetical protein [Actinacidiphila cocklensis]CAG6399095.1 conserved exported hypothetical protein [Actinacidiphila cocklensis]